MKIPIYMDYHATTPVDRRVLEAMLPYFSEEFGNAASKSHAFGWRAEEAVEAAREEVAKLVGASAKEIVWTSGATESDNLAVKGAAQFYQSKGKHLVTCKTEHKAVLDSMHALERQGFEVTFLDVEKDGRLDPARLAAALRKDTTLVSIMHANNETGVVHPIEEIGRVTRAAGVLFHCDAVQGVGKVPFDVEKANVDLASLSAHKMYGPKGMGALYVRRKPRVRLVAQMDGGGHERGFRSGTLNVPGIVGFGKAAELARLEGAAEAERVLALRERLRRGLQAGLDLLTVNGSLAHRVPGNLNVSFAYVEGEALMMAIKDVAVSSGSACTSASLEPSYVLRAMGISEDLAHSSIRFGLGRFTTAEEVDHVIRLVVEKVAKLREMSPLYEMVKDGRGSLPDRVGEPALKEEEKMAYSEKLLDHYENPRNVGSLDKNDPDVGTGLVGAPACGDVMKLQIRVSDDGVIEDAKFKTFGCGSAIASSSLVTEWVKGKTVDEALTIKNTDVANELNLPPVKIHCSVLAEDAIKAAVADWQKKHGMAPTVKPDTVQGDRAALLERGVLKSGI